MNSFHASLSPLFRGETTIFSTLFLLYHNINQFIWYDYSIDDFLAVQKGFDAFVVQYTPFQFVVAYVNRHGEMASYFVIYLDDDLY